MKKYTGPWQSQIVAADDLLDEDGNLKHVGYAKQLFLNYSRRNIAVKKSRIKEWDYYLINDGSHALALTVADNGYMGMLSASILDFTKKEETTKSKMTLFPMGKFNMPTSSKTGDVVYEDKKIKASFVHKGDNRILKFSFAKFKDKQDLSCEITLSKEPLESMVIVTPFDKPKHFYYNQKIVGFTASGKVILGDKVIMDFKSDKTRALLDWGRGVWTYKNTWYWGAGAGIVGGNEIAFNIGYGFGNTKSATENMIFINGKAQKLEHINVEIPRTEKNKENFLGKFKVTSSDGRFEAEFTPILDRHANTDIGIIGSNQHQVFGKFNGKIILDDGTEIALKDFDGFIEKVMNKW